MDEGIFVGLYSPWSNDLPSIWAYFIARRAPATTLLWTCQLSRLMSLEAWRDDVLGMEVVRVTCRVRKEALLKDLDDEIQRLKLSERARAE